jgi:hypothetical protein
MGGDLLRGGGGLVSWEVVDFIWFDGDGLEGRHCPGCQGSRTRLLLKSPPKTEILDLTD